MHWGSVLEEGGAGMVRPYFRTHGRTRPTRDLPIETLVSITQRGRAVVRGSTTEESEICALLGTSQSVAEVAARRRIPLGVARVLLSDLADRGLVAVHTARRGSGNRPSLELMERILHGLSRL
ncbi:Protein of unknown function [Amycolatopsis pretoriensis]|uniref:DUF742 domain-containing protein n=1 Tax=Amycolatopsis pretoriensis TaxID=218821 RepID=A0A1H5QIK8_9PSEU|nr:DUF742 domain-containing protein [Amycolatopsis pretoriensis]SEF25037.1 Protein of unknown function [Amycolatopsis pretoriensis]